MWADPEWTGKTRMITGEAARLGFDPERLGRIGDWMDGYVAARKFPGSSLLIARHGEEAYFTPQAAAISRATPGSSAIRWRDFIR